MAFDIKIYTDSTNTKKLTMGGSDVFAAIDYTRQNLVNVNQYAVILHANEVIAVVSSEAEPSECYECPEIRDMEDAFDDFIRDLKYCGFNIDKGLDD